MNDLMVFSMIQLIVTWILIGIIWFTQIVHYPLYTKIKEGFIEYERCHIRRTAYLFFPLMLIELITAIVLVGLVSEVNVTRLAFVNLFLLIIIYLMTFLLQIIQHQKLSIGFSKKLLHALIASNWIRALLWTCKGGIMIALMSFLFPS